MCNSITSCLITLTVAHFLNLFGSLSLCGVHPLAGLISMIIWIPFCVINIIVKVHGCDIL